jgi:hypothetical protein
VWIGCVGSGGVAVGLVAAHHGPQQSRAFVGQCQCRFKTDTLFASLPI